MILTVALSLLSIGVLSIALNYNSTIETLSQTMTETALITSDRISMELKAYVNVAIETGSTEHLANENTPLADKQALVAQRAATHGFEHGNVIMPNGISAFDGNDYSDRKYFTEAMAGKTYISEPLLSKLTGKLVTTISAPLWEKGTPNTKVVGVVCFTPPTSFLNDIVTSIKVSPNASAYIVDAEGYTIAHKDSSRVEERENIEELAKTKPELSTLASINANMRLGKHAFESYTFDGVEKFTAYAPISGTHGWSIALTAPTADFMDATSKSIFLTIFCLLAGIAISVFVAFRLATFIGKPMKACADRLTLLSKGDLESPVPQVNRKDETGTLAMATQHLVTTLKDIIGDEDYLLSQMANGNFDLHTKIEEQYVGDFHSILLSIRTINTKLSAALGQIRSSAEQVSAGSDQVSNGAQALSQGASQQASAVQQLSDSILEISQQIKDNANHAATANVVAGAAGENIRSSSRQMSEMIGAMTEISDSSSQIGKIIKTIEDIAFQTNILALNAAVEAARAGAAGKGFAVVADEVRSLATKSSEAAKQTNLLIEDSVKSVGNGVKIADATAKSLAGVVDGAQEIIALISKITQASAEQSISIEQINLGIDQIALVVQTNSATSEESAAASEELNGQADMMKQMVSKFKLNPGATESLAFTEYPAEAPRPTPHTYGAAGKY